MDKDARREAYLAKLRDPRWQKKRLEILNRDNWTCQSCYDTTKTLHVHHLIYIAGNEPWDYEGQLLLTLCEDCHEYETNERPVALDRLIDLLKRRYLAKHIDLIAVGLENARDLDERPELSVAGLICVTLSCERLHRKALSEASEAMDAFFERKRFLDGQEGGSE